MWIKCTDIPLYFVTNFYAIPRPIFLLYLFNILQKLSFTSWTQEKVSNSPVSKFVNVFSIKPTSILYKDVRNLFCDKNNY